MVTLEEIERREMPQVVKRAEEKLRKAEEEARDRFERMFFNQLREYVVFQEGKLQPLLVILGYRSTTSDNVADVHTVAAGFWFLHAYYHIQDDVVDEDESRNNLPTFWKRMEERLKPYGVIKRKFVDVVGFIGGNVARNLAYDLILEADVPLQTKNKMLSFLTELDRYANLGEYLELVQTMLHPRTVHESSIMRTYEYLTRYWVYGALAVGGILSGREIGTFEEFAVPLGIALQLKNDLEDLERGSDIREGRNTLLVWFAYNHGDPDEVEVLEKYLGRENLADKEVEMVKKVLVSSGAVEYVKEKIMELIASSREVLEDLPIKEDYREAFEELLTLATVH